MKKLLFILLLVTQIYSQGIKNTIRSVGVASSAEFSDVLTKVGLNEYTINLARGTYSDLPDTLKSNLTLNLDNGALLSPSSLDTLYVSGKISAQGRAFGDSLHVVFLTRQSVYPEMWGTDTVALRKSFETGQKVVLRGEYDLGGDSLVVPDGVNLYFDGGKFINGSISPFHQYRVSGDWRTGLDSLTNAFYAFPDDYDGNVTLDVTDLPGTLAKYNLADSSASSTVDNAGNLTALFTDTWFIRMVHRKRLTLLFPARNNLAARPCFVFKEPVLITYSYHLRIKLMADIKFDFSDYAYSFRDTASIAGGTPQVNMSAFRFVTTSSLEIIGEGINKTGSLTNHRAKIDGGYSTIGGTFFEGITISGVDYDKTEINNVLQANYCRNIIMKGVHITNGMNGALLIGNNVEVDNCEFSNITSDNGLTITGTVNATYLENTKFAKVSNCYAYNCADLGISIQLANALVENCLVDNCGNASSLDSTTVGIGNSFNAGGGYSTELLSVVSGTDRRNVNVTFINCVAQNCYNYGFVADCGGVKYINCRVTNITPSYLPMTSDTTYRYLANKLRGGAAFQMITTNYVPGGVREKHLMSNCFVDSVSFIFINKHYTDYPTVGGAVFENCVFKHIFGNTDYDLGDARTATVQNSEIPSTYVRDAGNAFLYCRTNNLADTTTYLFGNLAINDTIGTYSLYVNGTSKFTGISNQAQLLFPLNTVNSAYKTSSYPTIYGTTNLGTYPFTSNGNMVLQGRSGSTVGDIVIATGNTAVERFRVGYDGHVYTSNHYPRLDNTYYIGKNDDDSPAAWKGIILKDQTDGKYYRIELNSGSITIVDLTD